MWMCAGGYLGLEVGGRFGVKEDYNEIHFSQVRGKSVSQSGGRRAMRRTERTLEEK